MATKKVIVNAQTWKVRTANQNVVVQENPFQAKVLSPFVDTEIIRGPEGTDGTNGSPIVQKIAFEDIPAFRMVYAQADGRVGLTGFNLSTAYRTFGLNINATLAGEQATIYRWDEYSYGGWAWDVNELVYLGLNGSLTQTPPTDNGYYLQVVGIAIATTTLYIKIEPAVYFNR